MSDPSDNTAKQPSVANGHLTAPEEDAPTLRSVPIMAQAPVFGAPPPKLFGGGPVFGKAPPSLGLLRGGGQLKASAGPSSDFFGVKHEWSGSVKDIWNVKEDDLEPVPFGFPLEKTHREISGEPSKVAGRISEALRTLSIDAVYSTDPAKAKCVTSDCVEFHIRLFAGNEVGQPVIVEVQKRNGSAGKFLRTCRSILDAAEGLEALVSAPTTNKVAPKIAIGQMDFLKSECVVPAVPNSNAAIKHAMELLRSGCLDKCVLGLESLVSLADPVTSSAAIPASSFVLTDIEAREEIRALVATQGINDGDKEDASATRVRHLALVVFANALSVCKEDGRLVKLLDGESDSWLTEALLATLMNELKNAESQANNAYQASCGIHCLLSCSNALCNNLVKEEEQVSVLKSAHAYGLYRHELLASETTQCLARVVSK